MIASEILNFHSPGKAGRFLASAAIAAHRALAGC